VGWSVETASVEDGLYPERPTIHDGPDAAAI
jgi:hypothetical protein